MSRGAGSGRLRTAIVLTVVLAGIVPLAIWGLWVLAEARSAGEAVLRARLTGTLDQLAREMARNWIPVRSALTDLAEDPRIVMAATEGSPAGDDRPIPATVDWIAAERSLEGRLRALVVRDAEGTVRLNWRRDPGGAVPLLPPIVLSVAGADDRRTRGRLEVTLEAEALLPRTVLAPAVSDVVFAILDGEGRTGALPAGLTPEALDRERFVWGGEEWIGERRPLGDPPFVLAMAGTVSAFSTSLDDARRRAALGGLLAVGLGAAIALVVAGRLSSSLEGLARAADRVSRGDLDVRVAPDGPDEVARVGRAFNDMVASVAGLTEQAARREALAGVGEFAASMAHEIRNPLTSARLDLERSAERLDEATTEGRLVHRALGELTRLESSVTGALRLARSGVVERRPVEPAAVAWEALGAVASRFEARGAQAALDDRWAGGSIRADADALRRLLVNLLENAAAAVDEGGTATLRILAEDDRVVFEIADDGCGMSPEEVERATELLYTTRPEGTGLGLGIAQRIAAAHGGRLQLRSTPGQGTVVRVTVPSGSGAPGNAPSRPEP